MKLGVCYRICDTLVRWKPTRSRITSPPNARAPQIYQAARQSQVPDSPAVIPLAGWPAPEASSHAGRNCQDAQAPSSIVSADPVRATFQAADFICRSHPGLRPGLKDMRSFGPPNAAGSIPLTLSRSINSGTFTVPDLRHGSRSRLASRPLAEIRDFSHGCSGHCGDRLRCGHDTDELSDETHAD